MELVKSDGHTITPRLGSARQTNGHPADLLAPWHYPVTATCRECGREIWCKRYMHADWHHMDAPEKSQPS